MAEGEKVDINEGSDFKIKKGGRQKYICTLCSIFVNSLLQGEIHNNSAAHKKVLKNHGISEGHDLLAFLVECNTWSTLKTLQVAKSSNTEVVSGKEALDILNYHKSNGCDIPECVRLVVKVKKCLDFKIMKSTFDFEECLVNSTEIVGSLAIVEEDRVIGVLLQDAFNINKASELCRRALKLWNSGGYVERAADKLAEPMAMFGYRYAQTFGRYTHPFVRRQKEREISKENLAKAEELELFAEMYAEDCCKVLSSFFPSSIKELSELYESRRGLGRMGTTPFSGMGITVDYTSIPHIDHQDYGMGFISWFLTRTQYKGTNLCTGGEFILPEYGVYFKPRHGTILAFNAKIIYHGTRRNIGFTQVASVLFTKMKLVKGGVKRKSIIDLE